MTLNLADHLADVDYQRQMSKVKMRPHCRPPEDFDDHRRIFDGGDDLQSAAGVREIRIIQNVRTSAGSFARKICGLVDIVPTALGQSLMK
jgi:hypothetical protein